MQSGGFVVVASRNTVETLPAKHFIQREDQGRDRLAAIHGEFLVSLNGPDTHRDGRSKSPQEFQDGLNAEALRFLDILLWDPMTFDLNVIKALELEESLEVRLPRPGAYVIQKLLCSERRPRIEKRDKDLANVFDVAMLTHQHWNELNAEINSLRNHHSAWGKWIEDAGSIISRAFETSRGWGPDAIERVYDTQSVRATTAGQVVRRFATAIGLT